MSKYSANTIASMNYHGFQLDQEFDCFVRPNLGMFLANSNSINRTNPQTMLEQLFQEGCELTVGPPAPSNGESYNCGIYIFNYKEILRKRKNNFSMVASESIININESDSYDDKSKAQNYPLIADGQVLKIIEEILVLVGNYNSSIAKCYYEIDSVDNSEKAIKAINDYLKNLIDKYHGLNLYLILCSLKDISKDSYLKNIIAYIEKALEYEMIKSTPVISRELEEITNASINFILKYLGETEFIDSQNTIKIYDFLDFETIISKYSPVERLIILRNIKTYFSDRSITFPRLIVNTLDNLRNKSFEEKYSSDLIENENLTQS